MKISSRRILVLTTVAVAALTAACSNPDQSKRKHFDNAQAFSANGKDDQAILELKNALKIDSKYGEAREKLADAYLRTGNYQQGGKELIRAAELLPQRADLQVKAAALLFGVGESDAARKFAMAALKADPKNIQAELLLANALAGLKDTAGAVLELEKTMQLAPDDPRTYTSLGIVNAAAGQSAEAEAAYRKAIEMDPKSANARVAFAYYLSSTKRVPEAEHELDQVLALDRDNDVGNRLLASLFMSQGRTSDAETPLLRLVNKKDPSSMLTLGDVYVHTGRTAQARPLYEALAAEKETRAMAVARLATLDYSASKQADAYRQVDDVLKEDPNNTGLLTVKARWLVKDRRLDDALQIAQKAVGVGPQSASAHVALATVQEARGERGDAIKSYNEAIKLNPNLLEAELGAARLELARGNADASLQHVAAARRIAPRNGAVGVIAARASLMAHDLPSADREASVLVADYPKSAEAHSIAGQVLLVRRDTAGATKEFDKALALNPSDLDALRGRLGADIQRKDVPAARARLAAALSRDGRNGNLLVIAASVEDSFGDLAAAERYLRQAIDADPANMRAYGMLGALYYQQQRLPDAQKQFEQIVLRRPDNIGAQTMLGTILDAQNRHDESAKVYEAVLARTSRAPVAANNLAYIHALRGDQLDYALQLAQSAKQQMPEDTEVNDTLGWVYYRKDMPELAIAALALCARKEPTNPVYQYHLGMAYAKANQRKEAREALEGALRLNSSFPGADEARATLASLKG